jgi:hypothetical protein
MSESSTSEEKQSSETNGQNGSDGSGRTGTVVRAAAIAAASGATALAAKKAFGGAGGRQSGSSDSKGGGSTGSDTLVTTFLSSGWDSAKDTIVPMLEDAATHAGEYVARNAPEVVSQTIVPQFIRGFQRARSAEDEE